jgi:phenylalanyl-tRNA synthetase beta chain
MKISYNWLKEYIDIDLPAEELADLLTDIGLEVEGVEAYESVKGGLEGIVVGEVLEVVKHPNADKLSVATVNVGAEEDLQIVCGAPNVAGGQKVPVAVVGTTLYSGEGESFRIEKAKLRGVASEGMICAEDELGLGDDHSGILVLDGSIAVGTPLREVFPVETDTVFEIGLTPNRNDAYHHIGVARDLRAALNYRKKADITLKWPSLDGFREGSGPGVAVEVENGEGAPRYCGLVIEGLSVGPSPKWLQNRLLAIGQRPISNVVDITNFIMHEYGQPLHAFDLEAVKGRVVVKNLEEGTPFTTLDEEERRLSSEDLMICNGESGMCIAGVFGGLGSGVKESTAAIFLESAYFSPRSIRRTSTRHGLRTDAASHFEKGIDPSTTVDAMKRAALLITELAGGEVTSGLTDLSADEFTPFPVELEYSQLYKIAGADISKEDVRQILELLDIEVVGEDEAKLRLAVPPYRYDVRREADVIEEIMRIFGLNAIPIPKKLNASINIDEEVSHDSLYEKAAAYLVGNGFFEIVVNSITREIYNTDPDTQVRLLNNLNADLTVMRQSMMYPGLESIRHNLNHSNRNIRFFELGKHYRLDGDHYRESEKLAIWTTGMTVEANWLEKDRPADYYYIKSIAERTLTLLGFEHTVTREGDHQGLFHYREVYVNDLKLAHYGQITPAELKKLDISQDVFYAEIDWDNILRAARDTGVTFRQLPKYPSIRRDLALLVDHGVTFESVEAIGRKHGGRILREIDLFDVYQDKKMDAGKKSYAISFIFRDDHKTLSDKEVDKIMKRLMEVCASELKAVIR